MAAEAAQKFEALEDQAQRLLATFRRAGYEQAMAEAGLPLREAWSLISDYSANDAYKETKQLLADAEVFD